MVATIWETTHTQATHSLLIRYKEDKDTQWLVNETSRKFRGIHYTVNRGCLGTDLFCFLCVAPSNDDSQEQQLPVMPRRVDNHYFLFCTKCDIIFWSKHASWCIFASKNVWARRSKDFNMMRLGECAARTKIAWGAFLHFWQDKVCMPRQ